MGKRKKPSDEITIELSPEKQERLAEIEERRQEKPKIDIYSASIRSGLFCTYGFTHNLGNDISNDTKIVSDLPVHQDLKDAFEKMNPHLAVICEMIDEAEIEDISELDTLPDGVLEVYVANGISIDGKLGDDGVSITGYKVLSTGEHVKLTSPKVRFDSTKHKHVSDLIIATYGIIDEVNEYMGGKRAPQVQTEMFDEAEHYAEEGV